MCGPALHCADSTRTALHQQSLSDVLGLLSKGAASPLGSQPQCIGLNLRNQMFESVLCCDLPVFSSCKHSLNIRGPTDQSWEWLSQGLWQALQLTRESCCG